MNLLESALAYCDSGLSVLPVYMEGPLRKSPSLASWDSHGSITRERLEVLFTRGDGIKPRGEGVAVLCGHKSGNLEAMDFDGTELYPRWLELLNRHGFDDLVKTLTMQRTPSGGTHVFYRCPEGISAKGNLAARVNRTKEDHWGIDLQAIGGYVVVAPSEGYTLIQGSFLTIPEIEATDREFLHDAARYFNEAPIIAKREHRPKPASATPIELRPGDDFNARSNWFDVLEPLGWMQHGLSGHRLTWYRPGKSPKDGCHSATTTEDGGTLWVFSTNAHPFQSDTAYTKFSAYTLTRYGSLTDSAFASAARDLSDKGYGAQDGRKSAMTYHRLTTEDLA